MTRSDGGPPCKKSQTPRTVADSTTTTVAGDCRLRYPLLEPYLRRFFYWYGGFVHAHRWLLTIIPLILTPLFATGLIWFAELRVDDPAYVFTPKDASNTDDFRWKRELSTFSRLWPLEENKFQPGKSFETRRFVHILVRARDGGNVLRPAVLDEIRLLNDFIAHNISVPTEDGRFNLTYQDLCLSYEWVCGENEHIAMFREMKQVGRVIDLTFPKGGNKDTPVYLGTVLGDITLNRTTKYVDEARITQLFYFLKQEPESVRRYSTDFEYAVERFILRAFESRIITLSFAHYQSLQDGLDENAQRFVPNFVISFSALTVYCILCAFVLKRRASRRCSIDWVRSKPYVSCAGLFNTLISLISSFGLMLLIGVPYNVVNTIIPFLIIAIGIDDMFIMTACYDQVDRQLPTRLHIAEMMRSSGVAVTITNVTDVLSFLIGCLTDLPGVELFCVYAFVCVLVCYLYQMTFFAGVMAIMCEAERQERHCLFLYKIRPTSNEKKRKPLANPIRKCDIHPVFGAPQSLFPADEKKEKCSTSAWIPTGQTRTDSKTEKTQTQGQFINEEGDSERVYERFYNASIELGTAVPPRPTGYEYYSVSTIERRAGGRHPTSFRPQASTGTLYRLRENRRSYFDGLAEAAVEKAENAPTNRRHVQSILIDDISTSSSDSSCSSSFKLSAVGPGHCRESDDATKSSSGASSTTSSGGNASSASLCPAPVGDSHTVSENRTHRFFGQLYAPWLLENRTRAFVVFIYVVYLALALVGCSQFREGLEPRHLVTSNHYIAQYFTDIKSFWRVGPQLHVAVLNPPNFTDFVERTKLLDTVAAFENTEYTMGREGTVFFLLEYLNYLSQLNAEPEDTDRIWHRKLRSWLKFTGGSEQWERDIVYAADGQEFAAFRFQIAMKNIVEPNQHKLAARLLREVADTQPFRLEIYHEAFPFADQYLIILPSTYRNVLISLCVMTVIAFLLIPSVPSSVLIVLSIISICTGVFGYMTFWGVNLDAISMISIIMSIGFAVDLSAHIVYAFVTAHHGETVHERVVGALEHLGWPIFQGATSTIAGITVLYTVDAYIILTFFKTIWLTMVLGLVHGLVLIPCQVRGRRCQDSLPTSASDEKESDEDTVDVPCMVTVKTVKQVPGKCVRLRGGMAACQNKEYLEPANVECTIIYG